MNADTSKADTHYEQRSLVLQYWVAIVFIWFAGGTMLFGSAFHLSPLLYFTFVVVLVAAYAVSRTIYGRLKELIPEQPRDPNQSFSSRLPILNATLIFQLVLLGFAAVALVVARVPNWTPPRSRCPGHDPRRLRIPPQAQRLSGHRHRDHRLPFP